MRKRLAETLPKEGQEVLNALPIGEDDFWLRKEENAVQNREKWKMFRAYREAAPPVPAANP